MVTQKDVCIELLPIVNTKKEYDELIKEIENYDRDSYKTSE